MTMTKDDRDERIIARIQAAENELAQTFNQISVLLGCGGLTGTEAEEGAQHVADILGRWVEGDTAEGEGFTPELRQMLDQYSEIWSRCEAAKEELRSAEEEAREAKLHATRAKKAAALVDKQVQSKLETGPTQGDTP
jgi:hypothetical protein